SVHELEAGHDHDDFESFVVTRGSVEGGNAFLGRLRAAIGLHDVLRVNGFVDLPRRDRRHVVQARRDRVHQPLGRAWPADEQPRARRLRLAPILRLGHNFSVDLYMETVAHARLVIARLLGGSAYWPYGIERLVETCRARGILLALVPGDDKPDPELEELSTLA